MTMRKLALGDGLVGEQRHAAGATCGARTRPGVSDLWQVPIDGAVPRKLPTQLRAGVFAFRSVLKAGE